MTVRELAELTWPEVEALVSPRLAVLWPIGATEAHGPHLPLNTDVIISVEMARRAAARLAQAERNVLILPPLAFTPAGFASAFPGTISLSVNTAVAQIADVMGSLALHGIRTLVMVNSHVDPANVKALRDALARSPAGLHTIFPDITAKPWVLRMPEEFKRGGAHAGSFETSLVLAARPDLVRDEARRRLPEITVDLGGKIREGATTFHECGGPDAYFGNPASASPEAGHALFDMLADIVVDAVAASEGQA